MRERAEGLWASHKLHPSVPWAALIRARARLRNSRYADVSASSETASLIARESTRRKERAPGKIMHSRAAVQPESLWRRKWGANRRDAPAPGAYATYCARARRGNCPSDLQLAVMLPFCWYRELRGFGCTDFSRLKSLHYFRVKSTRDELFPSCFSWVYFPQSPKLEFYQFKIGFILNSNFSNSSPKFSSRQRSI